VMAVVATMLAGLASSEMTKAQYDRSYGAQLQSKAGDQWSFFQAKRLRGALQRNTVDLLQTVAEVHTLDAAALKRAVDEMPAEAGQTEAGNIKKELVSLLDSPGGQQALTFLRNRELPAAGQGAALDQKIKAAMEGVEASIADAEMAALLAQVDGPSLESALHGATEQARSFDAATKPINSTIDQIDTLLGREAALLPNAGASPSSAVSAGAGPSLNRDFTAARLHYAALRYETEARLNQTVANLYELQVRKSNLSAERHHRRSQRFFFGMLGAQLGVIVSTLAMAARNRNLLWSFAAAAGLLAIAFAVYVYLCV